MSFTDFLENNGWKEKQSSVEYIKGNWVVIFDTGSWMEIGTIKNPRVFDVPVPDESKMQWTLNLIEHLCKTDEKIKN